MKFNKISSGNKALPKNDRRASTISDGAVTLAAKRRSNHGWNGISPLATPIMLADRGMVVNTMIGGLSITTNLQGTDAEKELKGQ